jgi:hypothetical protein
VTGFPGIAPSTVDRLTSATIGFDFSNSLTGGSDSAQLIIETNATRFTSGFVSAFNTGQCNDYRLCPRRTGTSPSRVIGPRVGLVAAKSCDGLTTRNTGVWSASLACEPQRRTTLVKGFGRRPLRRLGVRWGRRSKASQGGNRGEVGGPFGERAYGDLRIADGWRARRRQSPTLGVFSGSVDGRGFRWRRCAGARRWPRSQKDLRPRAGVALVFRRAAGGGGDRRCAAGCGATVMSCRS